MNNMDRGSSVYQDLIAIFYMVITNAAIMVALFGCLCFYMAHYGYKNITVKFKKHNKILKQLKQHRKLKENKYIDDLEKSVKKKKHS